MSTAYWIEVRHCKIGLKWQYFWQIKCRNGRVKAQSNTVYPKQCLCINDANAIAESLNMEVRVMR